MATMYTRQYQCKSTVKKLTVTDVKNYGKLNYTLQILKNLLLGFAIRHEKKHYNTIL
jgi:hypothetical protein